MAAASTAEAVPIATLIHMVTIKLSSSNYLLWRNQVVPMLSSHGLLQYVDGSSAPPLETITTNNVVAPNPDYTSWHEKDQRILGVLLSSLTEESMSEVIGCKTSRSVWLALEAAFSHSSTSRAHQLREELFFLSKGTLSVEDLSRKFKNLCDQLAAIGRPVDASDQSHWFMRGLGPTFSSFSDVRMALNPVPSFRDLVQQAKAYELFHHSLDAASPTSPAFVAHGYASHQSASIQGRGQPSRGGSFSSRGGNSNNRGGKGGCKPFTPRCQICRGPHYADKCPQRYSTEPTSAQLAQAFNATWNISNESA